MQSTKRHGYSSPKTSICLRQEIWVVALQKVYCKSWKPINMLQIIFIAHNIGKCKYVFLHNKTSATIYVRFCIFKFLLSYLPFEMITLNALYGTIKKAHMNCTWNKRNCENKSDKNKSFSIPNAL